MFLQSLLTPKGRPPGETSLKYPQNRQYLSVVLQFLNVLVCATHLKTPIHEILHCVLADDGIERVTHLKVSRGNALVR